MAACSSYSDSPMVDLTELQEDANLAANYMLSVERSLDLKRQWAIPEFEVSLCQQEAQRSHGQQESQNYPFKEEPQCQDGMCQGSYGG